MSQKRRSDQQKGEILAEFAASGLSAAAFCRQNGLAYQSFLKWRRAAARKTTSAGAPTFVELELRPRPEARSAEGRPPAAELDLGAGVVLRLYPVQEGRP